MMTGQWRDKTSMNALTDGTSNTFLAGEMHFQTQQINVIPFNGPVYNGSLLVGHSRIGGLGVPILSASDEPGNLFGFGSWHPGVCNFVLTDGSTRSVGNGLDTRILGNLCHRSDGNITNFLN